MGAATPAQALPRLPPPQAPGAADARESSPQASPSHGEPSPPHGRSARGFASGCFSLYDAARRARSYLPLESQPSESPRAQPSPLPTAALAAGHAEAESGGQHGDGGVVGEICADSAPASAGAAEGGAGTGAGTEAAETAEAAEAGEEGVAWGRQEGVKHVTRSATKALARLVVADVAERLGGRGATGRDVVSECGTGSDSAQWRARGVGGAEAGPGGAQQVSQEPFASPSTPRSASHFALGAPLSWAVLPDSVSSFLSSPTPLHHTASTAGSLASDLLADAAAPLPLAASIATLSHPATSTDVHSSSPTADPGTPSNRSNQDSPAGAGVKRSARLRGSGRPAAISQRALEEGEEAEEGECDGSGAWSSRSESLYRPVWGRLPRVKAAARHEGGGGEEAGGRRAHGGDGSEAEVGVLRMQTVNVATLARAAQARQERIAEALVGARGVGPNGAGSKNRTAEVGMPNVETPHRRHRQRKARLEEWGERAAREERASRSKTMAGGRGRFVEEEFSDIVEAFLSTPHARTMVAKDAALIHA
ncbi:hypothetical protein CLOP_g18633 [Closterium sp. NIES-67]|nr:hypothetical protein CLOP_g18633 [Closterium sp. NIES-67]